MLPLVSNLRISEVAALMGVSDDTVRRYIDQGRLTAIQLDNGRKGVSGRELAEFLQANSEAPSPEPRWLSRHGIGCAGS